MKFNLSCHCGRPRLDKFHQSDDLRTKWHLGLKKHGNCVSN